MFDCREVQVLGQGIDQVLVLQRRRKAGTSQQLLRRDREDGLQAQSLTPEPGDVIAFHALTLHGASGNLSTTRRRRAFATRDNVAVPDLLNNGTRLTHSASLTARPTSSVVAGVPEMVRGAVVVVVLPPLSSEPPQAAAPTGTTARPTGAW